MERREWDLAPVIKQILPELGKPKNATSEKAQRVLGWVLRSSEEVIVATAESLLGGKPGPPWGRRHWVRRQIPRQARQCHHHRSHDDPDKPLENCGDSRERNDGFCRPRSRL
jgi:hypothetical protein